MNSVPSLCSDINCISSKPTTHILSIDMDIDTFLLEIIRLFFEAH